jgi:hypothetical protein
VGAEVDWAAFGAAGLARLRAGEADLQSLDFAQPAFWLGFGDPGAQVVADLFETAPMVGVGPEHRAADGGAFVDGPEQAPSLSLAMGLTTILTTIWVCPPKYSQA